MPRQVLMPSTSSAASDNARREVRWANTRVRLKTHERRISLVLTRVASLCAEVTDRVDISNWRRIGVPEWQVRRALFSSNPFVWKHSAFCVGVQLVEDMINCVNYLSELEDSPSESRLAFFRRRPIASENGMACVRSAGQRDLIAIWVVTPSAGERVFCSFQCTT